MVSDAGRLASSTNWPHYQHKDWLGSGRLQTEFSGTLGNSARTVDYDRSFAPYGEMYGSTGNDAYDLDFTGDVKTMWSSGLLDTPNREYHPNQARWISPDPAGAGWNRYAYPTNPNSETDPSGLFAGGIEGGPCDENDCGGTPCSAWGDCGGGGTNPCDWGACTFGGFGDWGISNVPPGSPPISNNIFTGQDCLYCFPLGPSPLQVIQDILTGNFSDFGVPTLGQLMNNAAVMDAEPGGNGQSAADIARCAAKVGNSLSLAALLPQGSNQFLKNALSNDFSTVSDLVTGPAGATRLDAAASVLQGRLTTTGVKAIGAIPVGPDIYKLGVNGAGTAYAEDVVTTPLAEKVLGQAAGALLGTAVDIKLAWDATTYAYGVARCW
jgi:RHS repeat-associated protein